MAKVGNHSEVAFAETGTLPYLARKHGGPLAPAAVDGVLARIRGLGLPSPRVFSE